MTRKINISSSERTLIVAALMAYDASFLATVINSRFEHADPANDGLEVEILNTIPDKAFREGWGA